MGKSPRGQSLWQKLTGRGSSQFQQSVDLALYSTDTEQSVEQISGYTSIPKIVQTTPSQKRWTIHQGPEISPDGESAFSGGKWLRFSHPTVLGVISPALPSASTNTSFTESDDCLIIRPHSRASSNLGLPGVNPGAVRRSYLTTVHDVGQEFESERETFERLDGAKNVRIGRKNPSTHSLLRKEDSSAADHAEAPTLDYLSRTPSFANPLAKALRQCNGVGFHEVDVLSNREEAQSNLSNPPTWLQHGIGPAVAVARLERDSTYPGQARYRTEYVAFSPAQDRSAKATDSDHSQVLNWSPVRSETTPIEHTSAKKAYKRKQVADFRVTNDMNHFHPFERHDLDSRAELQSMPSAQASLSSSSEHLPTALCPADQQITRKSLQASRLQNELPPLPLVPKPTLARQTQLDQQAISARKDSNNKDNRRNDNRRGHNKQNQAQSATKAASPRDRRSSARQTSSQMSVRLAACVCECDCNHCYVAHLYARMAAAGKSQSSSHRCHCECLQCLAAHAPHRVPGLIANAATSGDSREESASVQRALAKLGM